MGGASSLLKCAGCRPKVRKKKKHGEEIKKRRADVDIVKVKSVELKDKLSNHDADLVEERVRTTERRYTELLTTVDRKQQQYCMLGGSLEDIKDEANKYLSWLQQKQTEISDDTEADTQTKLTHLEELCGELDARQETLTTIRGKSASLVVDLPIPERDSVEKLVAVVQTEHDKTYTLMSQQMELIHSKMAERKDYQVMVDKLVSWLEDRERTAERNVTFRLLAMDVDKQADKCKSLCSEVQGHMKHLEPVKGQAETLKAESGEDLAATMDKTLSALTGRYKGLVTHLQHQQDILHTVAAARRQFEGDCQQIERWCEDAELQCSTDVPLDCAVEVLQEQMNAFQALQKSSEGQADLLAMTLQRGEGFYTNLYETDRPVLDKQLASLRLHFDPIATSLSERVVVLEKAVQSQKEAAASISQTEVWLKTMQMEMQQVPLGASVEDAEDAITRFQDVEHKLAEYQTSVSKLNETVSVLRSAGQTSQAEAVVKLTSHYEQLIDQVCQHQNRGRQTLQLRQQFLAHITDLENTIRQCQDKMAAMTELGVDVTTRIDRYREIKDKLVSLEPGLFVASDQAQQLAVDISAEDDAKNKQRVQAVRDKVKDVLTEVDSRMQQSERLQQEREDFEDTIGSTIAWLEQKEDILASQGTLNLDSDKVNPVLRKHQAMSSEALEKLSVIREKAEMEKQHYDELQEVIPVALTEKLGQIHSLEDSIKDAINKKEQYLVDAKADRVQYENSMRQVNEWLHGAEDMLDSGYDGLDYDTINNTLSEYTDYFSEASLCQDEMEQVMELSDKLIPTLDTNDKTTLKQSLASTNKKLAAVISTAQGKQEELECKASEWKVFQAAHQDLHLILEGLETQIAEVDKMAVVTPQDLQLALSTTKNIQTVMESQCRPAVDELNDHARSLDRVANSNSRSLINKHTNSINSRWNTLVAQMEAKLLNVQEMGSQWTDYTTDMEHMETSLQEVQSKLDEARHARDTDDLNTYITILQELSLTLSSSETRLDVLQRSGMTLQRSLPTAEARVTSQNSLLSAQENLERLRDEVRNELTSAREDQEDQQSYLTEMTQTITWFTHTQDELMQLHMGPDQTHAADSLQRYKVLQQDVRTRIQQFHRIVQVQEAKYNAQGKQLPESLRVQMTRVRELEASMTDTLQSKEEELLNLREDREQYQTRLELVTRWLTRADATLRKQIHNLDDSNQEHEVLLGEIPEFQTQLDAVRATGSALIQHTPDPAEKTRIQSSLAEVNRQFSATQSRVRERSQHLQEASRLTTLYGDGAASVTAWLGEAEAISGAELSWTDFETVNEELKTFQRLSGESTQSQAHLRSLHVTLKQLSQFSDTSSAAAQLDTMSQRMSRVSVTVQDHLSTLEDTYARIEEYETELSDITRWLEQTRAQLADRDPPLDVKAHLAGSEQLLQELGAQKSRAQMLLQRYNDLRSMAEVSAPAVGSRLLGDIGQLEDAAAEQCDQLRNVVQEQDRNDSEIKQLNDAIGEAQEKLLASPVLASSVDTLKQQIAEHDTLAAQIKTYQARLSQINEKNRGLSERSLQRSPTLVRRRFLMNTSAGSSGFSSAHFRDRSSPYFSGSHFGYTDSIEDSGAHMSDSLNTMPSSLSWSSLSDRSDRTSTTIRSVGRPREHVDSFDSFRSQSLTSLHSERGGHGGERPSPFQPIKSQNDTNKVARSVARPHDSVQAPSSLRVAKGRTLSPYSASLEFASPLTDLHARSRRAYTPPRMRSLSPKPSSSSARSTNTTTKSAPRRVSPGAGPASQLAELNTSWASLQEQVVAKEKELHSALQQQEDYQRSVQEVTAKMEHAQKRLCSRPLRPTDNFDRQQDDHKETLSEIDSIKNDIIQVREQSRMILDKSDPEGRKAMEATLTMLTDRAESLQTMAGDAGRKLQAAVKDQEKHNILLEAYKKRVKDVETWLSETRTRHVTTALPTDTMDELQAEMSSTRDSVEEVNIHLRLMSDLAVQCDAVCEQETPTSAEKLRTQLASLQKQLGDFKLETIDKQSQLRSAIRAADKRQREMSDYEDNVQKLQQWISDTKQMTLPADRSADYTAAMPEWHRLQQDLTSGLVEHRQLVQQISVTGQRSRDTALMSDTSERVVPAVGEAELHLRWEELQKDLAEKKQTLEDFVKTRKPGELPVTSFRCQSLSPGVDPSRNLEEIRQIVGELGECWEQLQGQVEDRQVRVEQALSFQHQYQQALLTISSWLDSAQHRLLTPDMGRTTQQQLHENETFQREIQGLQGEITTMKAQAQNLLSTTSGESRELIQQSLSNLNDRVSMLESQAQHRGEELRVVDSHWQQYQNEVDSLQKQLQDTQRLIHSRPPSSATSDDLVGTVQATDRCETKEEMETHLHRCEGKLDSLKKKETELSALYPQGVFPSELRTLQTNYMDLQRRVSERRASVLQLASGQEQYEKLLQDYAQFIETAEGKLRSDEVASSDLIHLRHQLNAHKDFFSDLEVHKAMLDSLASQCPVSVRDRHQTQHNHLSSQTHVLVDKASLHGQRLERLVRQWEDLDVKLTRLQGSLASIEQQIPGAIASGDSMATIQTKLEKYQQLQHELAEEKGWVFEVVDKGKQILHSLTCPELENSVARLADRWVDLNTSLTQDLKRTEILGDQLQTFEAEAAVLNSWLTTANMKLSSLKQLSEQDLQSMAAIRAKVEKLLEFQKEVENQLPLRSKVLNVGRQLMMSSSYNTTGLGERLQGYETEWAQLQRDIVCTEETLHQAQMDLMPSRQALHELAEWLDIIRTQLREDKNKPIHSLADMEVLLKKYKGYKIELSSKQLTVDFVNQQVLQPHIPEEDTEKLDFAEKLGEFNRQWKIFTGDVNDRLKTLERLSSKFEDYEKSMSQLQVWFREQEDKIKNYGLVGPASGVRQTLNECRELQRQLKAKESDILAVKSLAGNLMDLSVDSPGCRRGVQDSLDGLNRQWLHLEEQLSQLEATLEGMLGEWGHYSTQLQALMQVLTNIDYCLNSYTLVGGDISTLTEQVKKLRTLESELHHHENQRDAFLALGQQLTTVSDAPISADIQKTAADVQNRWHRLSADLSTRRKQFEQCLQRWQNYESEYDSIRRWLDDKEKVCHGLTTRPNDPASRSQCLEQSKDLQAEFDNIQSRVSQLCRLSDDLAKSMEPSTILMMTSRHSGLEQRLLGLRQILAQNIAALQDDLTSLDQFRDAFEVLRIFLNHAETVLEQADPNKSSDEIDLRDRLNQLKDLQSQFTNNYVKLDSLNIMGYKRALGDRDANQLRELDHRWHRLHSSCGERSKSLQANVLVQQDFSSKCDSWMTFLAQTEQDLAVDIAGNLLDLRDQQRMCQKFESEMYSRQQVLHAIVSDGGKMLQAGDVDDPAEFQQKLHLLSEQWRSVVRRANQRKAIIDSSVQQWDTYNNLSQQLRVWLQEKNKAMKELEFEAASLQQINSMLQKVKTTQQEFRLQEHSFKQIHEIGRDLQQRADPAARDQLKVKMDQLEQSWCDSYSRLEHHRTHLEELLQEWQECEGDIDDILAWLRETRQILASDLPTEYDSLQADLNNTKDIATSFANSEDRRQQLLSRERNLSRRIHSEDMNILAQRIRLLNKQWDELASQARLREQRLRDAMCRWSGFSDRVQNFLDWIKDMENTVTSSREVHVEDLLNRLETEVHDELMAKEQEKNQLMDQGHRLMKVSSDIRATDIEHRMEKLEDRWQHLQSVVSFRKRKLHETVLALRQLDISTRNLSRWLSDMEKEVGGAIVYSDCDWQEIQTKIHQQQELQKDIEQHSAGVASVLNLCEVLLHDSDACPTDIEYNALQHTRKTLDQRWRSICQLSPERRARIEESWQLWVVFKQDCKTFSDWLIDVETEVGTYSVEDVSVELTKEEIRKYETLQRNVHNHLGELENINKQYRRLAREGRTDTNGSLRASMQEVNDRWDHLQQRVTSIMKCLRNSTSIRTDFTTTRTSLMTWLTEMETQLNTTQRLSSADLVAQRDQINRLVEEINSRRSRFEYLDQSAVYLMQKGDADEVVQVQGELEEVRRRWKQVLERATVYNVQVSSTTQEVSVTSTDVRRREMRDTSATLDWDVPELESYLASSPPDSPPQKRRTVLRSPATTLDTDASKRVEQRQKMKSEMGRKGKTAKYDALLNKLGDAIEDAAGKLLVAERQISSGADSSSLHGYRSDCERAIETVQRLEQRLKSETGQTRMNYLDTQVRSVVQRWEILQLRITEREYKVVTERQDQTQFRVDLDNMLAWLDEAEALQSAQQPLPGDMAELESVIRQYKDFLVQLESKKARVLSINLISKNFINLSTADGRDTQEKLRQMNERWEAVNSRADSVHRGLQVALLQSQEFHHEIHDRYMWLESIENRMQKCEPINLNADETQLWLQYNRLMELHGELERNQPKILAIKDTTDQLYMNTDSQEMVNAKDKMHIIANRVRALLRLTSSYISSLEDKLHISARASPANLDVSDVSSVASRGSRSSSPRSSLLRPGSSLRVRNRSPFALSQQLLFGDTRPLLLPADETDNLNTARDIVSLRRRRPPLFARVLRTALPLQLLLLLLLGMACLVPICEDEYSCVLANNLQQSLSPMLRYTQGPPPM